ncbi:hypothetical protein [Streptomyces sp. AcH 505]|uniref:hypothetical protein n=1 Tax=Streptomyces sp. AcH 505 TaxID=352211 RepID=UPI0018E38262
MMREAEWGDVLDNAHDYYATVFGDPDASAHAKVREWLGGDEHRDQLAEAWKHDWIRRHPVARNLQAQVDRLRALTDSTPVGLSRELHVAVGDMIGDVQPAEDGLIVSFGEAVRNRREHDHPKWEDLFCMNLSSYMGERMAPVLRRLLDGEAKIGELEAQRERRRVRLVEAEADLQEVRGLLSPNGEDRRIPAHVEIHEQVAPAVEWLLTRVADLETTAESQRHAGFLAAIAVMRQEKLPMSVDLLEAQLELDELDAAEGKDTPKGESTRPNLGEFITCQRCSQGEWSEKAIERGWVQTSMGWLCPQNAASAAAVDELLVAAAERAAAELRALGTPETVDTELTGNDVRLHLLVATRAELTTWMERLGCDQGLATYHGHGLVTSHGTWNGVDIAVRADGVPSLPKPGEDRG